MSQTNFYSSLGDRELLFSSVFPSETIGKTEKNSFSPVEDFTPF